MSLWRRFAPEAPALLQTAKRDHQQRCDDDADADTNGTKFPSSASSSLANDGNPSTSDSTGDDSVPHTVHDHHHPYRFTIQLVDDHGLVLCPGYHRALTVFTSHSLIQHVIQNAQLASLTDTVINSHGPCDDMSVSTSPTLLPKIRFALSDNRPIGELVLTFNKGRFKLLDVNLPPATPVNGGTSAKLSMLRRLPLPPWSRSASSASPQQQQPNSAFPPPSESVEDDDECCRSEDDCQREQRESAKSAEEEKIEADAPSTPQQSASASANGRTETATVHTSSSSSSDTKSTPSPSPSSHPSATSASSQRISWFQAVRSWFRPHRQKSDEMKEPPSVPAPEPSPIVPPYHSTIRRVVVIGIHGWSLLGGMIGDRPLLIASRFCYYAEQALLSYCQQHGIDRSSLTITNIPLHGHGRVNDRVGEYLTAQLPLYSAALAECDHCVVISHSQGVLVATQLIQSLTKSSSGGVRLGCHPSHVTAVMLAGLHHGPFVDTPTDLHAATKELFTLSNIDAALTQRHWSTLLSLIKNGVKCLFVASVHDQVVPLHSALAHCMPSHPNVKRALYIDDYHYHSPSFLYSLLSLCLYCMNQNHHHTDRIPLDLLVHLSGLVRGSLMVQSGGAHSSMHKLTQVYGLATDFALSSQGHYHRETDADADTDNSESLLLFSTSIAVWSHAFTTDFATSPFNRHLLTIRMTEFLRSLESVSGLNGRVERERLAALYRVWKPKTKNLKWLQDALKMVFDPVDSDSDGGSPLPSKL